MGNISKAPEVLKLFVVTGRQGLQGLWGLLPAHQYPA